MARSPLPVPVVSPGGPEHRAAPSASVVFGHRGDACGRCRVCKLHRWLGFARWYRDNVFPHGCGFGGRAVRHAREHHEHIADRPADRAGAGRRTGRPVARHSWRWSCGAPADRARRAEGRIINLIAFDPAADFTVQSWLPPSQRVGLPVETALVGERVGDSSPGDVLTICGRPLTVQARLGRTGVGPFDESYFVSFATLDGLIAAWREICRVAGIPIAVDPSRTRAGGRRGGSRDGASA